MTSQMKTIPLALLSLASLSPAQDTLTLYQPTTGTDAYLVDGTGAIVHTWPGTSTPGLSVYLLPDGDLMRTLDVDVGPVGGGGGLERVAYDGTVEWSFQFITPTLTPHHDIEVLPNGNVLMIVWENIGPAAAIALGRNPANVGNNFRPDAIYEIQPVGAKDGTVVWEWHAQDHVIQDFDPQLPGFGVVADHPELIDINKGGNADWLHINGIDYNPQLDQIALSVPFFDEIWIIDHSTTTAEAASHSGGNSGKGGDILYRWGNPAAYDRGTAADQELFFNHDVTWIEEGRPGAGNLLVYNNGTARPTGNWSSVDEITPPVDAQGNYSLAPGGTYGPTSLTWTYSDPSTFYSAIMSGAERLENGNTLVCEATAGRLFEVDSAGTVVWDYTNPFGQFSNWVFKGQGYADCDGDSLVDAQEIGHLGGDGDGNGELDACQDPENYCTALANSSGAPASMGWGGSTSLAANDLVLTASSCPPNVFGLFAFAENQASTPLGDGVLCLAAPISRLPVVTTDVAGTAVFAFDNQNLPPTAPPLAAGTTWNFSFWFRDVPGGPAGFNLADGLSVIFSD